MQIIFISLDLVLKIIPGGEAEHWPSIKHIDEKRVAVLNSVPGPEDTVVDTAKVRACGQHWTERPDVEVTNITLFK